MLGVGVIHIVLRRGNRGLVPFVATTSGVGARSGKRRCEQVRADHPLDDREDEDRDQHDDVGHGYGWGGQFSIGAFAVCAGFRTWKLGGLELPVLVHTANNLFLFLLASRSRSSLQRGEVDSVWLLVDLPLTTGIT